MTIRCCTKCGMVKPLKEFHKKITGRFGRKAHCKICCQKWHIANRESENTRSRVYRDKHKQARNEYGRTYYTKHNIAIIERTTQWGKLNPKKVAQINHRWRKKNKHKTSAHNAVHNAVSSGILVRPEKCDCCGKRGKVQAHHESYAKKDWLKVQWLLPDCHGLVHRTVA